MHLYVLLLLLYHLPSLTTTTTTTNIFRFFAQETEKETIRRAQRTVSFQDIAPCCEHETMQYYFIPFALQTFSDASALTKFH